jgi:hypothetical protein
MVVVRLVAVIPSDGSGEVVLHPVTRPSALLQVLAFLDVGLEKLILTKTRHAASWLARSMEVWLALRLNRARQLPLSRGEGLP